MLEDLVKSLSDEVEGQPQVLEKFARSEIRRSVGGSVFVGAGDSYAAAQVGFFASDCRCLALDPYVIASRPEIAEGKEVYFISVSGRTRSNLLAAREVERHARRTTALTAVADSPLAGLTDSRIMLPMTYAPRVPGMLSFSLSVLAVMKVLGAGDSCDYRGALRKAQDAEIAFAEGSGTTYFLGNSLAFPLSLYAAAKVHEILGAKAHGEFMEEFNHLELFSLGRSDAVDCFSCFDPSGLAAKLTETLDRSCHVVREWGSSPVEKLFHGIFQIQLSVLGEAKRRGIAVPRFLSRHDSLAASDRMIY